MSRVEVRVSNDQVKHPVRGHLYRRKESGQVFLGVALPDIIEGKVSLINISGIQDCTNALFSDTAYFNASGWDILGELKEVTV